MMIQERSENYIYINDCRNGLQHLGGGARLAFKTLGDSPHQDWKTAYWQWLCAERLTGGLARVMVSENQPIERTLEWENTWDSTGGENDMVRVRKMLPVVSGGKLEGVPYTGGAEIKAVKRIIDSGGVLWVGVVEAGLESQRGGFIRGLDASDHHMAVVGHESDRLVMACSSWRELQHRADMGFFSLGWEKFKRIWRWSETGFRPKDGVNRLEVDGWMQHMGLVVRRRV